MNHSVTTSNKITISHHFYIVLPLFCKKLFGTCMQWFGTCKKWFGTCMQMVRYVLEWFVTCLIDLSKKKYGSVHAKDAPGL